jgi:hypothetical protein
VGAAAHLRSKKHGKQPSDHGTVVELLRIEILAYNESLARRKNLAAREAFKTRDRHALQISLTLSIPLKQSLGIGWMEYRNRVATLELSLVQKLEWCPFPLKYLSKPGMHC